MEDICARMALKSSEVFWKAAPEAGLKQTAALPVETRLAETSKVMPAEGIANRLSRLALAGAFRAKSMSLKRPNSCFSLPEARPD